MRLFTQFNFFKKKPTDIVFWQRNSRDGDRSKSGYVKNYRPGEDALIIHGSSSEVSRVCYSNGYVPEGYLGPKEFKITAIDLIINVKRDFNLDLGSTKKPLHLIGCYVSRNRYEPYFHNTVFARDLAMKTGRVIYTYDAGDVVDVISNADRPLHKYRVLNDRNGRLKPREKYYPDGSNKILSEKAKLQY